MYRSKYDSAQGVSLAQLLKTSLVRPWVLLFREPIVLLLSIYMAIIYGVLYMLFGAFPIVFQQGRGWSPGIGGLVSSTVVDWACCVVSCGTGPWGTKSVFSAGKTSRCRTDGVQCMLPRGPALGVPTPPGVRPATVSRC